MIVPTRAGLYCPAGDFFIDPSVGVSQAVITHAHADHARPGSLRYYSSRSGAPLLRQRLGPVDVAELEYGEAIRLGRAWVSLHPAGHILGSAQVRIEVDGEVWVVSGDYKRDDDPSCEPFEAIACDTFVTEATFASPLYRWPPAAEVAAEIHDWWRANRECGRVSLLLGYSLGKTQRLLAELARLGQAPVHLHHSAAALTELYREAGVELPPTPPLADELPAGALAIVPPSALRGAAMQRLGARAEVAFASGWMAVPSVRRRRRHDQAFVLSDHADWPSLLRTVEQTGAQRAYVMHGDSRALVRYLREERGIAAAPIEALAR